MDIPEARKQYVRWLRATRDLSPHTIRAYESDIAAFERFLGQPLAAGEVDRECVLAFLENQQASGLAAVSIRRRAFGLRGFFKWLHNRGLAAIDLSPIVNFSPGRRRTLPRTIATPDLERLFASLQRGADLGQARGLMAGPLARPNESTTLLAVALMLATGVRLHEVVGIRCADVELSTRRVLILGKGRRERHVFLPNDWIVNLTGAYLQTRAALHVEHSRLLFDWRKRPLTPAAMRLRLVKAAEQAGLTCKVTPHMLRHSAATRLIEAGVDIRYIQRLLGHASLATTEIYTHVSDQALKRVISDADVLGSFAACR